MANDGIKNYIDVSDMRFYEVGYRDMAAYMKRGNYMSLALEEQEVNIGFTRTDEFCQIYASDSTWITKMNKLCERNPEQIKKIKETVHGCTYELPKRFLSIRSKDKKLNLSDEQREEIAKRLNKTS